MKQYRTKVLKSVAILFLSFPLVYILWVATFFDIPFNSCVSVLLSPFYFIVSIASMTAGYGLWEMQRWSWYLFLISQGLIGYESALLVLYYAESHHKVLAYLLSILIQGLLTYRVAREIRVPYFFPKIRWWESNPRYRLSIQVRLTKKNGEEKEGEILDLSMSGCFVKLRSDFTQDEVLSVKFKSFGHEISAQGAAVWLANTAVTHPRGIGIKFSLTSKSQRRSLRSICRRLKKIGTLYRQSRYLTSHDEFLKKLEEIETQGIESPISAYKGS